ncbi:MAG: response regulator [bacterium]|nr:response regulator [bacterium]
MTKILLVEDDKSLREIYGVRLLAEGYDIVSAGDGEEALAMAIKERPNLIISDVMMPKISGFDMLDILRSTTETRGIKVIMMTALSSEEQRQRGEALGADRYLVKSQVGIEDVVKTVHDVLEDGHLTPEQRTANKQYPTAETPIETPMADFSAPQNFEMPNIAPNPAANIQPIQAPQPAPIPQPQPAPAFENLAQNVPNGQQLPQPPKAEIQQQPEPVFRPTPQPEIPRSNEAASPIRTSAPNLSSERPAVQQPQIQPRETEIQSQLQPHQTSIPQPNPAPAPQPRGQHFEFINPVQTTQNPQPLSDPRTPQPAPIAPPANLQPNPAYFQDVTPRARFAQEEPEQQSGERVISPLPNNNREQEAALNSDLERMLGGLDFEA